MFPKNVCAAIEDLDDLLQQLNQVKNEDDGESWAARLRDSFLKYLGPQSKLINRLDDLDFTIQKTAGGHNTLPFLVDVYDETSKDAFRKLIEHAKSHIKIHGVHKSDTNGNFLARFSNTQVIGGIITALGLIVPACIFIGNLQKDREMAGIERQLDDRNRKIEQLEQDKEQQRATIQTLNKLLIEQGKAMTGR